MRKTILTFGLISGAISALLMAVSVPFADRIGFDKSLFVGYTAIILSFLMVFFGIRSYRDNFGNGQITFGKGFSVGIAITLISCVFYVVSWEILYFNFLPDHMDKYGAYLVEKLRASGASQEAIRAQLQQVAKYKQLEDNPITNALMTFLEPFPVGLAMTLISAGVLRKKAQPARAPRALPA